jgi:hypothetical protein
MIRLAEQDRSADCGGGWMILYLLCTGGAFYVPTVSSWFLISFLMGGGGAARAGRLSSFMHLRGRSRATKFLYAPAPPSPTVCPPPLKPPRWALVHKSTYAPMIYTAQCIMFGKRVSFLGTKWHSPIGSMLFHRAQKTLNLQGPAPS